MTRQRGGYEYQGYTEAAEAAKYAPARGDYERQAQAAQAARALEKNTNVMNVSKEVENVLTPYTVQEHPSDKSSAGPGMYWKRKSTLTAHTMVAARIILHIMRKHESLFGRKP